MQALKIARLIKRYFNIKIIFGGVHVILSPEEIIKNKEVDIICIGEGEEVNVLDCDIEDFLNSSI